MKNLRFFALVVGLIVAASSAFGDDVRIARFDAKRVFEQYQHTKEVSAKRHPMGPGSATPEIEERIKLKERLANLSERVKQAAEGTGERERSEQAEKIAGLELQLAELRWALENRQRADAASEELRRNRAKLVKEIWSETKSLASERGYALVVPDDLSSEGLLNVITSAKCDDITDELIVRLNQKYQGKRAEDASRK
jgi:Skp family chaperone for outer membrane proteins